MPTSDDCRIEGQQAMQGCREEEVWATLELTGRRYGLASRCGEVVRVKHHQDCPHLNTPDGEDLGPK